MLSKVLQTLQDDQAEGTLIAPLWKTQTWFPKMLHMLMELPVLLPKHKSVPHNRTVTHPLWSRLSMMAEDCHWEPVSILHFVYFHNTFSILLLHFIFINDTFQQEIFQITVLKPTFL